MTYDKKSFLMGLRIGLTLGREYANTDLGWTCNPAYLANIKDTYLGYSNNRHFYKTNDGFAVGLFHAGITTPQYGGPWYGPALFSTVPENVAYYYGNTYLGYAGTFEYLGLTWYWNTNHHYRDASWGTPLPTFGPASFESVQSELIATLQVADVRVYHI